jgi:hypothetical protein
VSDPLFPAALDTVEAALKGLFDQEREVDRTVSQRQAEYIQSTDDYDNELRRQIDEIGEATRKTEEEFNELKEIDAMLLYLSEGGWNDVHEMIQLL